MKKQSKKGRKKLENPKKFGFAFRLDVFENIEFERQFDISEFSTKADFIRDVLSKRKLKLTIRHKSVMDYYMRLTSFHSQFKAIAVNYNQVLSHLFKHFPEREAKLMLANLEKQTIKLIRMQQELIKLIKEFEQKMEDVYVEKKIMTMDFLKSEK
ncbi:MAG: hypothetical protein KGV44_14840 [Flavobacteriaceae bacterium]|nr:hypothetical protein [Flavobacteriaceae bacterium]